VEETNLCLVNTMHVTSSVFINDDERGRLQQLRAIPSLVKGWNKVLSSKDIRHYAGKSTSRAA
jgi:hypothetical protein